MVFTLEDYRKIERWLLSNSRKDTQFPDGTTPLSGKEIIAIVQDGKNVKVPVKSFLEQIELLDKFDFINATERYGLPPSPLSEAIASIPMDKRQPGGVISFADDRSEWRIFQFIGSDIDQWQDEELWKDVEEVVLPIIQHNLTLGDDEDLIAEKVSETPELITYKLKLKDKEYSDADYSGLGRVWLRKNIMVDPSLPGSPGKNFLTQEMLTSIDTIYVVQYDYSIPIGVNIVIPANSILLFMGGSIDGPGTITFVDTTLEGDVHISAHIGSDIDSSITNSELKSSWFNWNAADISALSKTDNTIIVEDGLSLTDTVIINGGINCVGGGVLRFTGDSSRLYENLVLLNETANSPLPRNLVILSQGSKVQCGVKIVQSGNITIPIRHSINISSVRSTGGITTKAVTFEGTQGGSVQAIISGIISGVTISNSTESRVVGLEINIQENIQGSVSVDNITVRNVSGGNTASSLVKDNVIGIYVNSLSPDTRISVNNAKLYGMHGVGILCEGPNIDIRSIDLDMYSPFTTTLPLYGIKVMSDGVFIDKCKIHSTNGVVANHEPAAIFIQGKDTKIRNTVISFSQVDLGNMIALSGAKNFDIEATLECPDTSIVSSKLAISSSGNSYGKLNVQCKLPKWQLMNLTNTSTIDVKVSGEVYKAFDINASPAFLSNHTTKIHDCILKCVIFISDSKSTVLSNIDISNNTVFGNIFIDITSSLLSSQIKGNLFEINESLVNMLFSPVKLSSVGVTPIMGNTIKLGAVISDNILPYLMVIGNFSGVDISDNTFNKTGKVLQLTGTGTKSAIHDNFFSSENAIDISELSTSASDIIIQDNYEFRTDNIVAIRDLNSDGTYKSLVTII